MSRRPWFELNDDRLVVVRLVVGLDYDLCELFLDDNVRRKRSQDVLCKLVIMTKEPHKFLSIMNTKWGCILYEKPMDQIQIQTYGPNIVGLIPGPEQTKPIKIGVEVDWLSRIGPEYHFDLRSVSLFSGSWTIHFLWWLTGFYKFLPQLYPIVQFSIFASICWIAYELYKEHKSRTINKNQFRDKYPCDKMSWTLTVLPSSEKPEVIPILWNETVLPLQLTNYARIKLSRVHDSYPWKSSPPCDSPAMPRVLCSTVPSKYLQNHGIYKTPSGIPIKKGVDHSTITILPDIHEYNKTLWRNKRISQFKMSDLKKELMEAVWHPRRVAKGLVNLDD